MCVLLGDLYVVEFLLEFLFLWVGGGVYDLLYCLGGYVYEGFVGGVGGLGGVFFGW